MSVRLTRLDIKSVAQVLALVYAAMGVVLGILYALVLMVSTASMSVIGRSQGEDMAGILGSGIFGAMCVVVLAPLLYGLLGFLFGALFAWLYNLAAGRVGGILAYVDPTNAGGAAAVVSAGGSPGAGA